MSIKLSYPFKEYNTRSPHIMFVITMEGSELFYYVAEKLCAHPAGALRYPFMLLLVSLAPNAIWHVFLHIQLFLYLVY